MKMFEGEIYALLGHNGAGKTTTISMITGLIMPTHGSGSFHNVDLFSQMKNIRTTLGVCPQLDVLFEDMTVKEHLEMY
jgi:ATP-binding cassette subfamily A (ABC1) protein 3